MRDDAVGLFWDETPAHGVGARERAARPMPPIPDVLWTPPREFPNLSAARVLAVDTETKDPALKQHGPGWARGKGHIVGVSIAADNDGKWYFPVRHETESDQNMDPEVVFRYLRSVLGNPKQPKVGANLIYDLGWLGEEGIEVAGELCDVQLAEALLSERGDVNLDFLGEKYLGRGKETSILYRWLADWFGGEPTGDQRKHIYRAPPRLVGPYAEEDALMPLQIARAQWKIIDERGLGDVLSIENRLIRLLLAMRRKGVSVDVSRAEELRGTLIEMQQQEQTKLDELVGFHCNVDAAADLAKAFTNVGIKYPVTKTGRPSFTRTWLEHIDHRLAESVREIRRVSKLRGTFVESYILNSHIDGKVYGQFHSLRGDDNGTRSGRLSSSTPNLQNVPSRDKVLAPLVRGMFIPDVGHKQWRRFDYSQIEYRFLVHFAVGPGSIEAQERYHDNPDTDYHEYVIQLIKEMTRFTLDRKPAKNINFGLIYGMGIPKLLRTLGLSEHDGEKLFSAYHKALPYVKTTMEATAEEAKRLGYITTVYGRRSYFDLYEPARFSREKVMPLPYELALRKYGNVKRAGIHKALNRRLQGSAADMMKVAMVECWEAGVFDDDACGVPRVTVHDELGFSDPGGREAAFAECKRILETALPLNIPVTVDEEVGPDWGHVK